MKAAGLPRTRHALGIPRDWSSLERCAHVAADPRGWRSLRALRELLMPRINDVSIIKIPKPGKRSDSDIASAAANALRWHFVLESCDIQPIVQQGWITLSGHVSYGYQKTVAEGAVRYLLGVKGVFNDIEARPEVKATDVKQKIQSAFQRQASLDAKDIQVNVDDSAVVLQGAVHSNGTLRYTP
jgi:hypothetical protein